MASDYPPSSILSSKSPLVHVFSTPDLSPALSRSSLSSFSALLSAFETSVERVSVRLSTGYESKLHPRFPVHFVQRTLPPDFAASSAAGAGQAGGTPRRRNSIAFSGLQSPQVGTPTTPNTPFAWPTQAERDELFLDGVGSELAARADAWLGQTGREELQVSGKRGRRRPRGEDERGEGGEEGVFDVLGEVDEGWQGRSVESLTPWYAMVRDSVLGRREMVEWETFGQPVACVLALSTSHPDPLNALSALWDLTSPQRLFTPSAYPPMSGAEEDGRAEWAASEVLRVIVLVHDFGAGGGRDGWEDAQMLHDTIRKTYGHHTSLLPLFSAAPTATNPQPRARGVSSLWPTTHPSALPPHHQPPPLQQPSIGLGVQSQSTDPFSASYAPTAVGAPPPPTPLNAEAREKGYELSEDDLKALRLFMREFVVQSLVPFIERQVVVGNEQFVASRKSIGGRLWGASRRYFGASSGGKSSPVSSTGQPTGYNPVKGFYPSQAQEAQTRRLADLAFILGDFKLAQEVYDAASKEFRNDKAWRYYASACRMAGLSQLLQLTPGAPLTSNPDDWLLLATQTPLAQQPHAPLDLDAIQGVMLYYEAYRALGDWRPAPAGLVRTAGESEEVASALLLEQAAIADLHLPMPSRRKFAFHMSMAALRYEKSGLKSLSRRCLAQAANVFAIPSPPGESKTDPRFPERLNGWTGVRSHLHHSLGRQAYNVGRSADAVEHFLQLLVGAQDGSAAAGVGEDWLDDFALAWEHLGTPEEAQRVVAERGLKLPVNVFNAELARVEVIPRDGISLADAADPVWAELSAELLPPVFALRGAKAVLNTRHSTTVVGETFYLTLTAHNPLDAALALGGLQIDTDASPGLIELTPPPEIELEPRETKVVYVPVRALALGEFKFTGISYRFNDLLPTAESLLAKGKKGDTPLSVNIQPPVPILSVSLEQAPASLGAGEMRRAALRITNSGQVGLRNLRAVCSEPALALFVPAEDAEPRGAEEGETVRLANRLLPNSPTTIDLGGAGELAPGASIDLPLLCRGDRVGTHTIRWMFSFASPTVTASQPLLTSRASHALEVTPTLDVRAFVRPNTAEQSPHMLVLDLLNSGIPADAVVSQISSLSPLWRITSLSADNVDEDLAQPIGWQQGSQVFLAIEPIERAEGDPDPQDATEWAVGQLGVLLRGKEIKGREPSQIVLRHSAVSPAGEAASLVDPNSIVFQSILQTHSALRRAALTAQLPTIKRTQQRDLFPLFSPRALDLLVFWEVPSTGITGHHHLSDVPLGAGHNALREVLREAELIAGGLYAESQRERSALLAGLRRSEWGLEENPFTVSLDLQPVVQVDSLPTMVEVPFVIRNSSPGQPINFTLSLHNNKKDSTTTAVAGAGGGAGGTKGCVYAGSLTHSDRLEGLEQVTVTATLWIEEEGSYEVGDWRVEAERAEGAKWTRRGEPRQIRVVRG